MGTFVPNNTAQEIPIPVLRLLFPLLAGIMVGISNIHIHPDILFLSLLFLILFYFVFSRFISNLGLYRRMQMQGYYLCFVIVLSGILLGISRKEIQKADHFSHFQKDSVFFSGYLLQMPEEKEKSLKCIVTIRFIMDQGKLYKTRGKLLLYIQKSRAAYALSYGDELLFGNVFALVQGPRNPYQFDYRKYLMNKHIYHQAYLDSLGWVSSGRNLGNPLLNKVYTLRNTVIAHLQKKIEDQHSRAVAMALLAGYKNELDQDLKDVFAGSGAMHVLAVSGLHVGIIFVLINSFLSFLLRFRYGRFVKALILLFVLWAYALFTGFSPSVCRAATMFSFVIVGQNLGRICNVYNSILSSMFFLLCIDPFLICQAGFQLSYIAVLGIVYFQPKIYGLYIPKKWVPDQLWKLMSVSIAAQLVTAPIAMYYFHIFPTCFLLTNVVVIPGAMLVIYSGLIFVFSAMIDWTFLVNIASVILEKIISSMNQILVWIHSLPFSTIQGISYSSDILFFLYVLLLSLVLLVSNIKKSLYYLLFVLVMAIISSLFLFHRDSDYNTRELVVFSMKNELLLGFYDAPSCYLLGDTSVFADRDQLQFNVEPYLMKRGVSIKNTRIVYFDHEYKEGNFFYKKGFIQFYDKRIAVLDYPLDFPDDCTFAAIIVSKPWIIKQYRKKIPAAYTVLPYSIAGIQEKLRGKVHDLQRSGAFIMKIQ
jgi:competence protein ComEC